jgi:hypothetical protein
MGALQPPVPEVGATPAAAHGAEWATVVAAADAWYCGCCGLVRPADVVPPR